MSTPDTANPKDANGRAKLPLHLWPTTATAVGCLGFLEGELKYGRNNFRATDVAASVYVAAAKRHLDDWFEGQESASDTGSLHLGNALACIAIIVDAQANGTLIDDRNYVPNAGAYADLVTKLTAQATSLKAQFKDRKPKHWDARDNLRDMPLGTTSDRNVAPKNPNLMSLSDLFAQAIKAGPVERIWSADKLRAESDRIKGAEAKPEAKPEAAEQECNCLGCQLDRLFDATGSEVIEVDSFEDSLKYLFASTTKR